MFELQTHLFSGDVEQKSVRHPRLMLMPPGEFAMPPNSSAADTLYHAGSVCVCVCGGCGGGSKCLFWQFC